METKGVRKGTWTKEEDILLRNCIEKYGEGNWHKLPLRAGLNRCRKSCRLRWLNYLRPNLKKGYFTKDEVDLIVRLHKLLGNRWSLIAGRIPGRTADHIKNFWNSNAAKKLHKNAAGNSCRQKTTQEEIITKSNIIKPRPWNLTVSKLQLQACPSEVTKTNNPNNENLTNKQPSSSASLSRQELNDWTNSDENDHKNNETISPSLSLEEVNECSEWWSSLLELSENGDLCGLAKNHADIYSLIQMDVLSSSSIYMSM